MDDRSAVQVYSGTKEPVIGQRGMEMGRAAGGIECLTGSVGAVAVGHGQGRADVMAAATGKFGTRVAMFLGQISVEEKAIQDANDVCSWCPGVWGERVYRERPTAADRGRNNGQNGGRIGSNESATPTWLQRARQSLETPLFSVLLHVRLRIRLRIDPTLE